MILGRRIRGFKQPRAMTAPNRFAVKTSGRPDGYL